ncbi:HD domain-containing protein [Asticcacaulis solisilvae]|uniref:HD domain-containing protein n=1 Tax=Asticcacaulis solisilvae TaxID=1217274 RepID=UPI003FD6C141
MPSPSPAEAVKTRWMHLANDLQLPAAVMSAAWSELETAYSEPHRHYHTLTHIEAVLSALDSHRGQFDDAQVAELALVYHDLVYDPARQDNETQSAARLLDRLSGYLPEARLARAAGHIEATRHHNATEDLDANLLLDIDMSVLGAPWPDYLAYAQGVRAEYEPIYGAEAYAAGRAKLFLEPTLAKDRIFLTQAFARLESAARENLDLELSLWRAGNLFV